MVRPRSPRRIWTAITVAAVAIAASCVTDSSNDTSVPPVDAPTSLPGEAKLRYPRLYDDPQSTTAHTLPATRTPRVNTDPQIEELLDSLSLRQRIGQRFIAPIPGSRVGYGAGREILSVTPAGFIVYPRNFRTKDEVTSLIDSLQFVARSVTPGISLLICTDQEGGRVQTFRFDSIARFPSAAAVGSFDDPSLVRSIAYVNAKELQSIGVNMNLAPVLDLYGIADDSIIGDRSYGADPDVVASFVRPYLEASREVGVIATAKHFPGHGVTTVDSHAMLPIVDLTREELFARELVPFREAIDSGVPAIMTGHLLFEKIDPFYPVTLSRIFLHDILRDELGFNGVIITDGLEMGAIRDNFSLTETLVRLFRYDVDLILLFQDYDVIDLVDTVEQLIAQGQITEDDVNRGVRRVLALKRDYGLIDGASR